MVIRHFTNTPLYDSDEAEEEQKLVKERSKRTTVAVQKKGSKNC